MSNSERRAYLACDAGDEHVEITVLDGNMDPVRLEHTMGRVELEVDPGAYMVQFRAGNEVREKLVLLANPGDRKEVTLDETLPIAATAPISRASTSRKHQSDPARATSQSEPQPMPGHQGGSTLFLFVRDPDATEPLDPSKGLTLHDVEGRLLVDLDEMGEHQPEAMWAAIHIQVDPGPYILQLATGRGQVLRQVVYTCQGWQTQVFLLARTYGYQPKERRADLSRMSLLMSRSGEGFDPDRRDLYLTEVALKALERGTGVPGSERSEMLWSKFGNPMLGIYGAHLYLRRTRINPETMETVFNNLYSLVGPHPDVLALGWALLARAESDPESAGPGLDAIRERLGDAGPIETPPMLRASWDYFVKASYMNPGLISDPSLSGSVALSLLGSGAWLIWQDAAREPEQKAYTQPVDQSLPMERSIEQIRPIPSPLESATPSNQSNLQEVLRYERGRRSEEDVYRQIEEILDQLAHQLESDPEAIERLYGEQVSDLERQVAQYAFPDADPLMYRLYGRDAGRRREVSSKARRSASQVRPSGSDLAQAVDIPASSLLRVLLSLLARVQPGS